MPNLVPVSSATRVAKLIAAILLAEKINQSIL